MREIFRGIRRVPTSRLSRRIVFWVFISVVTIEAIILVPSMKRREQEQLRQLAAVSAARVSALRQFSAVPATDGQWVDRVRQLTIDPVILGGVVYRADGTAFGEFGELPTLSVEEAERTDRQLRLDRDRKRFDAAFPLASNLTLIIRHDSSSVCRELKAFFWRIVGLVLIISAFVTAGAWFALEPIVVRPVLRLREDLIGAGEAVSHDREPPDFYSATIRRRDELGEVIGAFNRMFRQISEAIDRRKQAEKALSESYRQVKSFSNALNAELERGREMQVSFLPARLPQVSGWEISAYFKPARQVAGDFYDVFQMPGGKLALVIADVCDKGVGAALFMALFRSLIRIFSGGALLSEAGCRMSPATGPSGGPAGISDEALARQAVFKVNNYIIEHHGELGMFATLFFGVLDPGSGTLHFISGGHESLFILNPGGGIREYLKATGPAVGITSSPDIQIGRSVLASGDVLFCYTDGVTEAHANGGEFYTRERLERTVALPSATASALIHGVSASVLTHSGDGEQADDITMLAVRRLAADQDPESAEASEAPEPFLTSVSGIHPVDTDE